MVAMMRKLVESIYSLNGLDFRPSRYLSFSPIRLDPELAKRALKATP